MASRSGAARIAVPRQGHRPPNNSPGTRTVLPRSWRAAAVIVDLDEAGHIVDSQRQPAQLSRSAAPGHGAPPQRHYVVRGRVDDALDQVGQLLERQPLLAQIVVAVVGPAYQGHDVARA